MADQNIRLKIFLFIFLCCINFDNGNSSTLTGISDRQHTGRTQFLQASFDKSDDGAIDTTDFNHKVSKRDVAKDLQYNNITTKVNQLNDTHQLLMVHWAGEGSDVVICLARDPSSRAGELTKPSAVYISYDYGDSYLNKTEFFRYTRNGLTSYASIEKFFNHPKFITNIVFLDKIHNMIFTTVDFGKTFQQYALSFNPVDVSFHPENPSVFLIHDDKHSLWATTDFGVSWSRTEEYVEAFYWMADESGEQYLIIQREEPNTSSVIQVKGLLTPGSSSLSLVIRDIVDCWVKGDFIFVTRKDPKNNQSLDLLISHKRGDFKKAIFQSELNRQAYHIVDADNLRVMVAVSHSEYLASLYVSDVLSLMQDNIKFSISLERVFCYFHQKMWTDSWLSDVADSTFADVHKVEGMKGIYIASQVLDSVGINPGVEHLRSVITFDWGGEWKPLKAPRYTANRQPVNCDVAKNCSLHLSQKFAQMYPVTRSAPILSSKSAPGVILATGTLGSSLKGHVGLYMSQDAGLTWSQILQEYYLFNFGDHGGVLVAVKYFKSIGETNKLKYSTDEGESWKDHEFTDQDLRIYGLMTEPGENTTIFTMFGSARSHHQWLIVKVDLKNAFSYNCTSDDYKFWSPGSGDEGVKMTCLLGVKETYERRVPHSNCYNGRNYDRPVKMEICPCDAEDFECDFGFERGVGMSQCIRNKSFSFYNPYMVPNWCRPGKFYNRTKGYLKIEGDACVGGNERHYMPDLLPCPYDERKEFILLAQKDRIVRFDLVELKLEELPIRGLQNVIAIEFDIHNNCVYWADIITDTIGRQCLGVNNSNTAEILVERDLASVEGMALDWMSNMLYFVDGIKARIQVIRTDIDHAGRMRRTVLGPDVLHKPRGIALHPAAGYMYWTDWAVGDPCVSRANLDGSNVKRLFGKPEVEWPNGITIDFIAERIYFVDAKEDFIGSADLDGKHFRKIIHNKEQVAHPFAVAVFKDNMYWDDWKQNGLFLADKDHGVSIQSVADNLPGLMDLKVYAHSLQEGTNKCSGGKTCSHLCFAQPANKSVCLCPDSMELFNGQCYCPGRVLPFANDTCPEDKDKKCSAEQFKCKNDLCIPKLWACDGDNDCGDFSDEVNCGVMTCAPDQFQCVSSGKCISPDWRCDYDRDCEDGSDEKNCTYVECTKGQFKCANNRCISQRWVCDMEDDCRDGSDEANCTASSLPSTCSVGYFKCNNPHSCIPGSWRCDGEKDCPDNSDEVNCEQNVCQSWQFQCKNKRCIFKAWQCDGDYDCGDGDHSDEEGCNTTETTTPGSIRPLLPTNNCTEWMFECNNKKCIPYWWKCDTVNDCGDNSDEVGCEPITGPPSHTPPPPAQTGVCQIYQFRCLKGDCIQDSWVCDGIKDCDGGEDEEHCQNTTQCDPTNQFRCRQDGSCIPLRQVCDGIVQCPDFTDEISCSSVTPAPAEPSCHGGMFPCDNNRCLPLTMLCDGHIDCYDEFDERNCNATNKVYQILQFSVDAINSTSAKLFWTAPKASGSFEFLPTYKVALFPNSKWINTTWTSKMVYQFKNLKPYTIYNMTVYVRNVNTKEVYPPAKFFTVTTTEWIPEAPWNVEATQLTSFQAKVSWRAPSKPNGPIVSYQVCMTPPIPPHPLCKSVHSSKLETLFDSDFDSHKEYSFWVSAKNSHYESNNSEVVTLKADEKALLDQISDLQITSITNVSAVLQWSPIKNADQYRILVRAISSDKDNLLYPELPVMEAASTKFIVDYLAPGTEYQFEVVPHNTKYVGRSASISKKTLGLPLPQVVEMHAEIVQAQGTSVKIGWTPPKDSRKIQWEYGIYYGRNLRELLSYRPVMKTSNTSVVLHDLAACESYIIAVGILGSYGAGPLTTSPKSVMTKFNPRAQPRNLKVITDQHNTTVMLVTWSASCPNMTEPVAYELTVSEVELGLSASFRINESKNSDLQHSLFIQYGGHYNVCVSTAVLHSIDGLCVEYVARPLPRPHQVQIHEANGTYALWWQDPYVSSTNRDYHFVILESPGSSLSLDTAKVKAKLKAPPYLFNPDKPDTMYSYAVLVEADSGYRSKPSETVSLYSTSQEWALVKKTVSWIAVPSLLVITAICFVLAAALAFVMFRHRRLQRTFSSFANSHFSTRSGTATFTSDGLEDEDSPVIRGFSDDEPLVIA